MDATLLELRLKTFQPESLIRYESKKKKNEIEIPWIRPDDEKKINLATINFLNVLNNEDIKKSSENIIRKYGVGTCGPRAFYGTTDVHVELEERIAQFFGTDEAIVYSNGYMAIASAIAAYCKRSDIVFTHEDCNVAIKQGIQMARSKIFYFDHQNPDSFSAQIALANQLDKSKKYAARKFLIVEGVSWKMGKLLPLPEFIKIAEANKIRIFLEDSYAIGIYGRTGRGSLEHFNIEPFKVDLIISKLEAAIGTNGGFCAGPHLAIEHQRLSGSGYMFSASLPTYLVNACIESFKLIDVELMEKLHRLTEKFHYMLVNCGFLVHSHPLSAMKVFNVIAPLDVRAIKAKNLYDYCRSQNVYFILEDYALIINLNVNLLDQSEQYEKIVHVLCNALEIA